MDGCVFMQCHHDIWHCHEIKSSSKAALMVYVLFLSKITDTTRRWWQCDKQGLTVCMVMNQYILACSCRLIACLVTNPCEDLGIHGTAMFKGIHHLCWRTWCNDTYACHHWSYLWCTGMLLWLLYEHSKAWLKDLRASQMLILIAYENFTSSSTRCKVMFLVLNMFRWQLFQQDVDDEESF